MYQRKINRHKLRKIKEKKMKSRIFDIFFSADWQMGHKKDFAWQEGSNNPYKLKKTINFKKKMEILLFIISFLSTFFIIVFHPFFHINKIDLNGLQRIKENEMKEDIMGIMKDKKIYLFPKTSYFFTDIDEMKDILKNKYPIESIIIKKKFPNELSITLEEKISTVIYDNGNQYSYLGLDGNIVEVLDKVNEKEWIENFKITTTTLADGTIKQEKNLIERIHKPNLNDVSSKFGNYPIIYDAGNASSTKSIKPLVKPEIVAGIINWYNFLSKKTDIPFGYVTIEDGMGKGLINTREGWNLIVDLLNRFDAQIDELNLLLKEKVDRKNLNYIDLRFPNKVYWK